MWKRIKRVEDMPERGKVRYMLTERSKLEFYFEKDDEYVRLSWHDGDIDGYKGDHIGYKHKTFQEYLDSGQYIVI